jgi:hypothetical protein
MTSYLRGLRRIPQIQKRLKYGFACSYVVHVSVVNSCPDSATIFVFYRVQDFLSPVVVIFYVSLQVLCRLQLVRDYSKCLSSIRMRDVDMTIEMDQRQLVLSHIDLC